MFLTLAMTVTYTVFNVGVEVVVKVVSCSPHPESLKVPDRCPTRI